MKPRTACSAGRADTAESTPARPLHGAARVRVHSQVGVVRWRPSMRRMDTWIPPYPAHHPDARIRTTLSSRALHVTPIITAPLRCVSACTLALPPRRAITSLPLSWHSSRCFHATHGYKRRPSCCTSFAPAPLSAFGKPSPPCSPLFSIVPSVQSHLTPPLSSCTDPGALLELGVAPQPEELTPSPSLSSGAVDRASELRISVACPPHCELVLSTMSGRCTMVHGQRMCSPSRRPPPTTPRCALCVSLSRQSYRDTRAASRVGVSLGNPHAPCQTTPGQAMPCSVGSLRGAHCHRLGAGELARTAASRPLCTILGEARRERVRVTPRGLASLAVGHVISACSALWLGHGMPSAHCVCGPRSDFGPVAHLIRKFIFF
jgi:hypothetical protein